MTRRFRIFLYSVVIALDFPGTAFAFRSVAFAPDKVSIVTDDGGSIEVTPKSFPDEAVTGFSGLSVSSDRRHAGWRLEETGIAGASPVALGLFVVGPHTRLDISTGQEIHAWRFLPHRRISVCSGPTHGPQRDTCSVYALPD